MGPGTPAMRGVGRASVRDIRDGRWIAMDAEQEQFLEDGTFVLKWELHWVAGWSSEYGEYRASMVDNYGHAMVYADGSRTTGSSSSRSAPTPRGFGFGSRGRPPRAS